MLLVAATEVPASRIAEYALRWGYAVCPAWSRERAIAELVDGLPVCAAIVEVRLPDGSGLDVVERVVATAPAHPPMLLLVHDEDESGELLRSELPRLDRQVDSNALRLWLSHIEDRAFECALAWRAEELDLRGWMAELFLHEGSGVRGAALERATGVRRSTLSWRRKRFQAAVGTSIAEQVALARSVFKPPLITRARAVAPMG